MRDSAAIISGNDRGETNGCLGAHAVTYDARALSQIVTENLSKVQSMARSMARTRDLQDDLVSAGVEAMLKSLTNYVPIPGVPFFAYAKMFVRSSMQREADFLSQLVDIPELHLRNARNGRMAAAEAALVREAQYVSDIDDMFETTSGQPSKTAESSLVNKDVAKHSARMIELAIKALDAEETEIIRSRFLEEETVDEVAARLDISPQKMRKIEQRARSRMRSFLLKRGVTAGFMNSEN